MSAAAPGLMRTRHENIARSLFSLQINPLAGRADVKKPGEIRYNGTLRASAAVGRMRRRNLSSGLSAAIAEPGRRTAHRFLAASQVFPLFTTAESSCLCSPLSNSLPATRFWA
ncbi:hypothetical protein BCAR13_490016 [Paraburkholderia caribensis]|jgi:hypothetical protein|nr:hypothetical protein BCAR13_490016 [Paraburkholderia caribensis]